MRLFSVPESMKSLPRAEKREIMKAVQRGRRVDDPGRAGIAVEYAVVYARSVSLLALVFSISAALNLLELARDRGWFRVVLALVWLATVPLWLYSRARVRRSLRLNQALSDGYALPH